MTVQMKNMLNMVVEHFSKDPKNLRAIFTSDLMGYSPSCTYSRKPGIPENIGCAIGMFLSDEVAEILDKNFTNTSVENLIESAPYLFPKWMQEMPIDFLNDLQRLHDDKDYWNLEKNTISEEGLKFIEQIKNTKY